MRNKIKVWLLKKRMKFWFWMTKRWGYEEFIKIPRYMCNICNEIVDEFDLEEHSAKHDNFTNYEEVRDEN